MTQDGPTTLANDLLGSAGAESEGGETAYFTRTPSGALISMRLDGSSYYYVTNYQGSVVALTNAAGDEVTAYSYDPYGNLTGAEGSVSQPFGYAGGFFDASSGLYHFGARYYDPTLDRWTRLDPSGQSAGYTYADDNPVNNCDPAGTKPLSASAPFTSTQALLAGGFAATSYFLISHGSDTFNLPRGVVTEAFKEFLKEAAEQFLTCGAVTLALDDFECEATVYYRTFETIGHAIPVSIEVEPVPISEEQPGCDDSNGKLELGSCIVLPNGNGDIQGDPGDLDPIDFF